ncbi:hypothetical protein [Nocardia jejuensis]|uniref:hypothetical protein n=1 Tax=Nocardia jejuensis TaxID=328049 RepID=UPI0008344A7A|nr:hypothetical protein [Nocardia jejuensis]
MRRHGWLRAAALGLLVVMTSGCIGAVDRADFEHELRGRGGGLDGALADSALAALRERLGTGEVQANVILLTAPNSTGFRLVLSDQPDQVTRFFAAHPDTTARQAAVRLRVRGEPGARRLDDYCFTLGALGTAEPVRVSAFDDLDGEGFTTGEVTGLSRLTEIVDTALARSELPDGQVTVIVVSRFGREIRMVANVSSPRTEMIAEFDRTGAFLRIQQA